MAYRKVPVMILFYFAIGKNKYEATQLESVDSNASCNFIKPKLKSKRTLAEAKVRSLFLISYSITTFLVKLRSGVLIFRM